MFMMQVRALTQIPGLSMPSMMGNKAKALKMVLYSIVEPNCFSNFTWTGKAPNGRTKNALKKYPKIVQLLHTVVKGGDETYVYATFLYHLKEKVIKYAYE